LWNPDKRLNPAELPTPGQILAELSENRVCGAEFDMACRKAPGKPCGDWPRLAASFMLLSQLRGNRL
jgi:hypothetical protein